MFDMYLSYLHLNSFISEYDAILLGITACIKLFSLENLGMISFLYSIVVVVLCQGRGLLNKSMKIVPLKRRE